MQHGMLICACLSAGEHLRYLNREIRTRDHNASDEAFLDVHIPVAALETFHLDPKGVSLHLLDTPGPNEYGEESLKHQVSPFASSSAAGINSTALMLVVLGMGPGQSILCLRVFSSLCQHLQRLPISRGVPTWVSDFLRVLVTGGENPGQCGCCAVPPGL